MFWTLSVEPDGRPGRENMWIDAALLRAAGEGAVYLRLYRWAPGCLSFGRNEPARTRYDRARIEALGLDTVRRPTGGRAVWHEAEVTYAVAGPVALFGSLAATYEAIHRMLAAALRMLGVESELAPRPTRAPGPGAGACFAAPVGGEIIVGGRKVVGSAQVREGGAFLQHGSILLADGQDLVARVLVDPAPAPRAAALGALLRRDVTFAETADAVVDAAAEAWGGAWQRADPPAPQEPNRFADPDWTWRR